MLRIPYKVLFISISCLLIVAWRLDLYGQLLLALMVPVGFQIFLELCFGVAYTNCGIANSNESPWLFWSSFIFDSIFFAIIVFAFVIHFQNNSRFIVHVLSGKCIDVAGAPGKVNGAPLQLWDCASSGGNRDHGSPTDQKWRLQ